MAPMRCSMGARCSTSGAWLLTPTATITWWALDRHLAVVALDVVAIRLHEMAAGIGEVPLSLGGSCNWPNSDAASLSVPDPLVAVLRLWLCLLLSLRPPRHCWRCRDDKQGSTRDQILHQSCIQQRRPLDADQATSSLPLSLIAPRSMNEIHHLNQSCLFYLNMNLLTLQGIPTKPSLHLAFACLISASNESSFACIWSGMDRICASSPMNTSCARTKPLP